MLDQDHKIILYNQKIDIFIWLLNAKTCASFESKLIVYTH